MSFDTVDLWYREALSSCTKFGKVSQRQARAGSQESRRAGKLAAQRSVHMPPRQVPGASGGPRPQHHASKRDGKSKRNRRTRNRARGTARDHAKLLSSLQPMKAYVCAFQDQTGGWYGTSSAGRADMQVHEGLVGLLTKTPQQRRADDVERAARITRIKRQYTQPADAFRGLMKERKALIQRLLGDLKFLTLRKKWQEDGPPGHLQALGDKIVDFGPPVDRSGLRGRYLAADYGFLDTSSWTEMRDGITLETNEHIEQTQCLRVSDIMTKKHPPHESDSEGRRRRSACGFISRMSVPHMLVALALTLECHNPGGLQLSQRGWFFCAHCTPTGPLTRHDAGMCSWQFTSRCNDPLRPLSKCSRPWCSRVLVSMVLVPNMTTTHLRPTKTPLAVSE